MNNVRRNMFLSGILKETKEISFKMDLPYEIEVLNNAFKDSGYKIYVVGGAVRDSLQKKTPKDYDVATEATPEEVVDILNKNNIDNFPKGEAFGVVSAIINGEEVEIATFRSESYDGSGRRPTEVKHSTIEQDANRRDLTINALYYDVDENKIIDFHGGVDDLLTGTIKTVGEPEERFYEDRLRIMRAIRFKNITGGDLDDKTKKAILKYSEMPGVSSERIRDEFYAGLKKSKEPKVFLNDLYNFGIMKRMFPKLNINTNFISSKNPILVVSFILKNNNVESVVSTLTEMKYNNEEKRAIKFLLDFLKLFTDFKKSESYLIDINSFSKLLTAKESIKDSVDEKDFIIWSEINKIDKNIAKSLYNFDKLKIKDLPEVQNKIESGQIPIQGKELGFEIDKANYERFLSLI
jgi:tRNA nucleotidyltransferase/poly(A) polymerase